MDKILRLKKAIDIYSPYLIREGGRKHKLIPRIHGYYKYKAFLECFVNHDFVGAKQSFYQSGLGDILLIEKLNRKLLDYGIGKNRTIPILLSDSKSLLKRFSNINYPGFKEGTERGVGGIYTNTIQNFVKKDYSSIARNLNIMEEKVINVKRRKSEIIIYEFFQNLLNNNKDKLVKCMKILLSDKERKKRMKHEETLIDITSYPTIGFLKMCWLEGVEIEIDSPYIQMELMPLEPNPNYIDKYPFLWNMEKNELFEYELE